MATSVQPTSDAVVLERGPVRVKVSLRPFKLTVRRDGRRRVRKLRVQVADGVVHDQFIQLTEGVVAHEDLEDWVGVASARVRDRHDEGVELHLRLADGREAALWIELVADFHVRLELTPEGPGAPPLRLAFSWEGRPEERLTGLGARHGVHVDQRGRHVQLGADRRYTGPDCPAEMLEAGGIPMGDYTPVPFLTSSRGWAGWLETWGNGTRFDLGDELRVSARAKAGPLVLHLLLDRTPQARLRRYERLCGGFPAVLPEWAYGHWKSRDFHEHQDQVHEDHDGYREHGIPLDAIVVDSPWETQYNTWDWNRFQFPDPEGMLARLKADGVRLVLWVTPWLNLESADGQIPPQPESRALHLEPAPTYEPAAEAGHFVKTADGAPFVARWWMGTGSPLDLADPAAEAWWRAQAKRILEMGVEGIKADDGEGVYFPDDVRFADGTGADAAWRYTGHYMRSMQRALDEVHPQTGVLFARSGWSGTQGTGMLWGGDQASDFWSLQTLVAATITAASSGFSNWSHDVGGYLGERLQARAPRELFVRWAQFGALSPQMQAHSRFPQEAWTYDAEVLDLFRGYVLLHEALAPYLRAAARTASLGGPSIVRPLSTMDPGDAMGWGIADAYFLGPHLWVAPVLEAGAEERETYLPRGRWVDAWTGERVTGGREVVVDAPLARIPLWVREGALVPTWAPEAVARGLADVPEAEKPLVVTLWGDPPCGRTGTTLADGTRIRSEGGAVTTEPPRQTTVARR